LCEEGGGIIGSDEECGIAAKCCCAQGSVNIEDLDAKYENGFLFAYPSEGNCQSGYFEDGKVYNDWEPFATICRNNGGFTTTLNDGLGTENLCTCVFPLEYDDEGEPYSEQFIEFANQVLADSTKEDSTWYNWPFFITYSWILPCDGNNNLWWYIVKNSIDQATTAPPPAAQFLPNFDNPLP
jgi:hypothetical protein